MDQICPCVNRDDMIRIVISAISETDLVEHPQVFCLQFNEFVTPVQMGINMDNMDEDEDPSFEIRLNSPTFNYNDFNSFPKYLEYLEIYFGNILYDRTLREVICAIPFLVQNLENISKIEQYVHDHFGVNVHEELVKIEKFKNNFNDYDDDCGDIVEFGIDIDWVV